MLRLIAPIVLTLAIVPQAVGAQSIVKSTGADNPANQSAQEDSLWNGAILGGAVGAMVGSFGSFAITDCSECAGFNVPLTFGVIGAGAGIGIGAGLDALHSKKGVLTERPRRVRVSPVIARDKRGVIASLQF
jgi:hypothetical protein